MRGITDDGTDTLEQSWAMSEWTFGPDGDIQSKGSETATGWMLEVMIPKRLFLGTDLELPWADTPGETYDVDLETMPLSFAIGIDDDDAKLPERTGFELQYWWPITPKLSTEQGNFVNDYNLWSSEEVENGDHAELYGVVPGNNLNGGSLGIMYLSNEITPVTEWVIH